MPEYRDFRTDCPRCGAEPEKAELEVVSGTFHCNRMKLTGDGFAFTDAKSMGTSDERVYCSACHEIFPLTEAMLDDDAEDDGGHAR